MKNKTVSRAMLVFILLVATCAVAAPKAPTANAPQDIPAFPGTLVNARYVYVTSYDGDQFDPNVLPEDRQAIATVQNAMEKWGKFIIVYEPHQADIVLMVMSRPTEDVLAVYDAHRWPANGQYLWRMMGRSGLQASEAPLIMNLEKAFDLATTARK
jgi:predicted Zn-dependent protease